MLYYLRKLSELKMFYIAGFEGKYLSYLVS